MLKKHLVLLGITIAIVLLLIATRLYPGGSLFDKNSIGFDWTKNFMSNLFGAKAMNGSDNPYLYGSGNYELLAIMQKVAFACKVLMILSLHYYVEKEHFVYILSKKTNK